MTTIRLWRTARHDVFDNPLSHIWVMLHLGDAASQALLLEPVTCLTYGLHENGDCSKIRFKKN